MLRFKATVLTVLCNGHHPNMVITDPPFGCGDVEHKAISQLKGHIINEEKKHRPDIRLHPDIQYL